MKQKIVKLNDGQEFIIKNSFRTIMLFEELRNKEITEIKNVTDHIWWLYCTLKGCNRDTFIYNFDEFVDLLDENPHISEEFNEFNSTPEIIEPKEKKTTLKKIIPKD